MSSVDSLRGPGSLYVFCRIIYSTFNLLFGPGPTTSTSSPCEVLGLSSRRDKVYHKSSFATSGHLEPEL